MKKPRPIIINTIIMTATSLLISSAAMSFNVYISNIIGAKTLGIFQLIMSVYSLGITLATSGVGLATTRLVAEELARGHEKGVKQAVYRCMLYAVSFGVGAAVLLMLSADFIGTHWLRSPYAVMPLRCLAAGLPFIAMSSVLHGYFNAVQRVFKSSVAQILEQILRIAVTLALVGVFLPHGLEMACMALVIGGLAAEVFSFVCIYLIYHFDKRRLSDNTSGGENLKKRLTGIALPVAFSSYLRSALGMVKQIITPVCLGRSGVSSENALAGYGTIRGMVMPLLFFPAAFLSSFGSLLVPQIAMFHVRGENDKIQETISRIFRITLMFSICVGGILFGFADEIGGGLYKNAVTAPYIRMLAPLVPLMYFDGIVDGLLKGLNQQVHVVRINVIDTVVTIALTIVLLPAYGIKGYILSIIISETLNFVLSFWRLVKVTRCPVLAGWIVKPLLAVGGAVAAVKWAAVLQGHTIVAVTLASVIFIGFMLLTGGIRREDAKALMR